MNKVLNDFIVAEVRKNREDLLAEFDGDTKKLTAYLDSKWSKWEGEGFVYETETERQARFAWNRRQREDENRRIAVVS